MGLLDLVEEHHAVGLAAHRIRKLPALAVANVAGRRANQARGGVALLELRHVNLDQAFLGAEHELGQRLGQLGLAHARGAKEDKAADRPLRILEAGARAAHRLGDGDGRLLLADHTVVQELFHLHQAQCLVALQARHGDARPHAYHLGDILLGDVGPLGDAVVAGVGAHL